MKCCPLILVVAPDDDLRRSIEFALLAEGYTVDMHASTGIAFSSSKARRAQCAVVDEAALGGWSVEEVEFRKFGKPVIVLVGLLKPVPPLPSMTIVAKPFLGFPLIEAVRSASSCAMPGAPT